MNTSSESNPYEGITPPYKIIVVGDASVGKTTLIHRMVKNEFCEDIESTVGVGSFTIQHCYDRQNFQFDIFDTAGQEKYNSVTKYYIKGAAVALICFDPLKPDWGESIRKWQNLIMDEEKETEFIVVGTKYDLWHEPSKAKSIITQIHKSCDINDIIFVSSLTKENVQNLLNMIAQKSEDYSSNNKVVSESIPIEGQDKKRLCSCF